MIKSIGRQLQEADRGKVIIRIGGDNSGLSGETSVVKFNGDTVKAFCREMERAYWNPDNCPAEWLRDTSKVIGPKGPKRPYWDTGLHSLEVNWALGTPERMKKLTELLETARTRVATPREKARLERLVDWLWTDTLEGYREHGHIKQAS